MRKRKQQSLIINAAVRVSLAVVMCLLLGGGGIEAQDDAFRDQIIEQIRKDRDNILSQAKRLLEENKKLLEENKKLMAMKEDFDRNLNSLIEEKNIIAGERERVLWRLRALDEEIEQGKKETDSVRRRAGKLEMLGEDAVKEKERLEKLLVEAKSRSAVGKLERTVEVLKRDKRKLSAELENDKKTVARREKAFRKERSELKNRMNKNEAEYEREMEEYGKHITALQGKNIGIAAEKNALARELAHLPGKFTKIARENNRLARATADRHYNLGVFYAKNGEHQRAVAEFEETLRIRPGYPYALYNLGHIYATYLLDKEKSIEYFREYLKVSPDARDKDLVRKYIVTWETWGVEGG